MRNFNLRELVGFLILSIFMFSCSNELHMTFPEGPVGSDGLSAYEVWVKEVNSGTIVWDKNNTDINNFFLYLKGADGKDGQNGVDGKNAYQLWVEQVKIGLDNPHNTGTNWSVENISMQDFWYFLTGAKGQNGSTPIIGSNGNWFIDGADTGIPAKGKDGSDGKNGSVVTIGTNGSWFIDGIDTEIPAFAKDGSDGQDGQGGKDGTNGKSAYELWVEEVDKGLEDPHNPGIQWDKTKTTTSDFWEYLRGADGNDGADGSPGEIGEPGQTVTIVKGKPNVIAQYSAQEFSEYVRWTDGGVAFIVYDDQGSVSPGAKVKGLPGIVNATKVYTADENGQFIVPKEDLPLDKAVKDRFGTTAEVEYLKSTGSIVTEVSAPNSYVPSRMQIRLRVATGSSLSSSYICTYTVVERKTDSTKDWVVIPSYLASLSQYIRAYELRNMNDPTSYTTGSNSIGYNTVNISSTSQPNYTIRSVEKSEYVNDQSYWDGKDHYFNLVLESYYGENPDANIVVKMAPIQYMPLVKNVKAYNYSSTLKVFSKIEGEFDFGVNNANINPNLIFKSSLKKETITVGSKTFDYYYPELDNIVNYSTSKLCTISFNISSNTATSTASISTPIFTVLTPYIGTTVSISSSSYHFRGFGTIGSLNFESGQTGLTIVGTKNKSYNFPDILVQQVTE